jgi:hypothetical protein
MVNDSAYASWKGQEVYCKTCRCTSDEGSQIKQSNQTFRLLCSGDFSFSVPNECSFCWYDYIPRLWRTTVTNVRQNVHHSSQGPIYIYTSIIHLEVRTASNRSLSLSLSYTHTHSLTLIAASTLTHALVSCTCNCISLMHVSRALDLLPVRYTTSWQSTSANPRRNLRPQPLLAQ